MMVATSNFGAIATPAPIRLDDLDQQILEMLRVNARLPVVKMALALGVTRSKG